MTSIYFIVTIYKIIFPIQIRDFSIVFFHKTFLKLLLHILWNARILFIFATSSNLFFRKSRRSGNRNKEYSINFRIEFESLFSSELLEMKIPKSYFYCIHRGEFEKSDMLLLATDCLYHLK